MPRTIFVFVIILFITASCKSTYKKCNCETGIEELTAYSQLLNELVEHHFYNFYLGKDEEKIFAEYAKNPEDTQRIDEEVIRLQNRIFNDTTRFCILYLDTTLSQKFRWAYNLLKDTSKNGILIKSLMWEVKGISPSMLDTLQTIQTRYVPHDFALCTAKIEMAHDNKSDSNGCMIGKVRLSKIYFNSNQHKGLLFCEFICGGLCGYGRLFLIEKIKDRWFIKKSHLIWIS